MPISAVFKNCKGNEVSWFVVFEVAVGSRYVACYVPTTYRNCNCKPQNHLPKYLLIPCQRMINLSDSRSLTIP